MLTGWFSTCITIFVSIPAFIFLSVITLVNAVDITAEYDYIGNFRDGVAVVMRLGIPDHWESARYGFIDTTGKEIVPLKYEIIGSFYGDYFSEGLAAVGLDGKWGLIDAAGKEILPADYDLDYVKTFNLQPYASPKTEDNIQIIFFAAIIVFLLGLLSTALRR